MPKNEDGEFELLLGNRQLLSVFFIVVILLGVFFTMGYIVGRNSAPLTAEATPPRKADVKVVEPPTPSPAAQEAAPADKQSPPPAEAEPDKGAPVKPEPVAQETAKSETSRPEPAKHEPAKREAPVETSRAASDSPSGSYLQLAATTQREADIMVDVLRKKRFKAIASEVPEKHGLFRVLVGPLTDGVIGKTRADLQSAGFPGNAAISRKF